MSLWRHNPIRSRSPGGYLEEAGYQWDEARLSGQLIVAMLGLISGATALVGYAHGPKPGLIFLLPLALICVVKLTWSIARPRIVVFEADGGISTPNGVAKRFWVERLNFDQTEIASIELTADGTNWGVVLFTKEGRTVLLSHAMQKADARLVAVQLTKALREIRESLSTVESRQRAAPAAHAREIWVH
ncbi:hypothetical protein W911_03695 [Hyphomicrobium nitrativorans NL23]|uniref:Uncharacterized protein n=2 Tax=Hyphomicrobium TaxID=81 RepID=V5SHD5_9HYPH|nr:hypothetical protein W911_03695 [Hyphomicrobium nitrativorans NL23]